MSEEANQWEEAQPEITLVYFRYWGERDENNERIYEREEMTGFTDIRDVERMESYFMNHSEVKNHFIQLAGEGWEAYDEGDIIVEWQENAN